MYLFKIYDNATRKITYYQLGDEAKFDSINFRMQELSSDLTKCKDEKLKLQAVVEDLTQVNRRWQRYNNDMQIYIKKLQATIEEQQEQLNDIADFTAKQVNYSHEGKLQKSFCLNCQPLINNLKLKISSLESDLNHFRDTRKNELDSKVLGMQLRLDQAHDHINNLNKIMLNKGILKTGYNLLPDATKCSMTSTCRSVDGLKFYECDSETSKDISDLEITSKGIDSRGCKSEFNLHNSILSDEKAVDLNGQTINKSYENIDKLFVGSSEYIQTLNNLTDSNEPHCSKTSFDNFSNSYEDLLLQFSSITKEPPDRSNETNHKISNKGNVWNLKDILKENADTDLLGSPMHKTCPICSTMFPPNSDDSFNKHVKSCQFL